MARMSAVEEMAGMDILCSDKTGTLTLNELTVDKPNVLTTVQGMSLDEVRAVFSFTFEHALCHLPPLRGMPHLLRGRSCVHRMQWSGCEATNLQWMRYPWPV